MSVVCVQSRFFKKKYIKDPIQQLKSVGLMQKEVLPTYMHTIIQAKLFPSQILEQDQPIVQYIK